MNNLLVHCIPTPLLVHCIPDSASLPDRPQHFLILPYAIFLIMAIHHNKHGVRMCICHNKVRLLWHMVHTTAYDDYVYTS